MALQPRFVDRIFTRLLARYGTAWIRAYEGVDDAGVHRPVGLGALAKAKVFEKQHRRTHPPAGRLLYR